MTEDPRRENQHKPALQDQRLNSENFMEMDDQYVYSERKPLTEKVNRSHPFFEDEVVLSENHSSPFQEAPRTRK